MPRSADRESRHTAFREGLALLAGAAALSPLLFAAVELLPSRENTRVDELPSLAVSAALVGLALIGVGRIGYALLAKGHQARRGLPTSSARSPELLPPEQWERSSIETPPQGAHHTPR